MGWVGSRLSPMLCPYRSKGFSSSIVFRNSPLPDWIRRMDGISVREIAIRHPAQTHHSPGQAIHLPHCHAKLCMVGLIMSTYAETPIQASIPPLLIIHSPLVVSISGQIAPGEGSHYFALSRIPHLYNPNLRPWPALQTPIPYPARPGLCSGYNEWTVNVCYD